MFKKTIEINYYFYLSANDNKASFTLTDITDEQAQAIADGLTLGRHNSDRKAGQYYLGITKTEKISYEREPSKWCDCTIKSYTHIVETHTTEYYSAIGAQYDERTTETKHRAMVYTGEFVKGFGRSLYLSGIKDIKYRH